MGWDSGAAYSLISSPPSAVSVAQPHAHWLTGTREVAANEFLAGAAQPVNMLPQSLLTLISTLQLDTVEERERPGPAVLLPQLACPELAGVAACLGQPGGEVHRNVEWPQLLAQPWSRGCWL